VTLTTSMPREPDIGQRTLLFFSWWKNSPCKTGATHGISGSYYRLNAKHLCFTNKPFTWRTLTRNSIVDTNNYLEEYATESLNTPNFNC